MPSAQVSDRIGSDIANKKQHGKEREDAQNFFAMRKLHCAEWISEVCAKSIGGLDYIPLQEYRATMKLNELKSILESHPGKFPRFILPDGDQVPAHFHLTEVGHVMKNFIDCGGTIRKTESSVLQLWVSDDDADHRLDAGKMAKILSLGERVLPHYELEVEVEYDDYAISQFPITGFEPSGDHLNFTTTAKHTDCLAREKCGVGDNSCATEPAAASCC